MVLRTSFLLLLIFTASFGQTFHPDPKEYYIGRGEASTLEAARAHALANLIEQIQIFVSSSLHTDISESTTGLSQSAEQSTHACSSVMLRDVQEDIVDGQQQVRVVKYISRSAVKAMYDAQRRQIIEFITAAESELSSGGDVEMMRALSGYYKAWLLSGMLPDTLSYSFKFGGTALVSVGILQAMRIVFDRLEFAPQKKIDDDYTTWKYAVRWSGRPVKHLHLTYHDGLGENEEEVKNGTAQMTFLFTDKRERRVIAQFAYHDIELNDAQLAAADSLRSEFTPQLDVAFILPGEMQPEKRITVIQPMKKFDTVRAETAQTEQPVEAPKERTSGPALVADTVNLGAIPAILRPLLEHPKDMGFFKKEIDHLGREGNIVTGKRTDFETLDGLYVLIVDPALGIIGLLRHNHGIYTNTSTGETILLPQYVGKRTLWIQVQ